ncbi:MAG: CBS domain-containing protein [bacterium]|nr:CBS domain-containing protein [bacterium]
MTSDQLHRLPVVEPETGELVGVVSALDIVAAVPRYGLALAV